MESKDGRDHWPEVGRMRTESEKINIPQDIIDTIKGHLVEPKKAKI